MSVVHVWYDHDQREELLAVNRRKNRRASNKTATTLTGLEI